MSQSPALPACLHLGVSGPLLKIYHYAVHDSWLQQNDQSLTAHLPTALLHWILGCLWSISWHHHFTLIVSNHSLLHQTLIIFHHILNSNNHFLFLTHCMYFNLKLLSSHYCHHFFYISFLFIIVACYHGNQTCWYPRICNPRNLVSLSFWWYWIS